MQQKELSFFLGANSPEGFYSLYSQFTDPERERLRIIKGGPGSGKSTFMRLIAGEAEKRGIAVEYIRCSGDPDSLDGIKLPSMGLAYVDGTSPHVMEPVYAGSGDNYVSLSDFCDTNAIRSVHQEVVRLTKAYKAAYNRAYALIRSSYEAFNAEKPEIPAYVKSSVRRRAKGIADKELKTKGEERGRATERFLSATTCKGQILLSDSVPILAERVYLLDNELGLAKEILDTVAETAGKRGWDLIRCPSPMAPEICEHIIIPGLSLAFISQRATLPYSGRVFRHLHLDRLQDRELGKALRARMRSARRLSDSLEDEAIYALKEAKRLHDLLEETVHPYIDFAGVTSLALRHTKELFPEE